MAMREPAESLRALYVNYGRVVGFGVRPFRYVGLFGPDANRYVLAEHPENFRWREALRTLIPVIGDTAIVVSDGEDHDRRRHIVQPAFATRRLHSYVDVMRAAIDTELDSWLPGTQFDAYARLRAVIRNVAVAALFGETLGTRSGELGDALAAAIEFVNLPLTHQPRIDLPWTRWHRARRARHRADRIVADELARRRTAPRRTDSRDVLDLLIDVDERGAALSDDEIQDQVISLVAAGYDTTSAAAAWVVYELLVNRDQWLRAATEVRTVVGDADITFEHLGRMRYLDAVIKETLRKWPPAFVSARYVVQTFEFEGHTIPRGTTVLFSPYVTHRDPRIWPDPERFDPDRWNALEPAPYTYIPFGGGSRRCIGFAFASLEMKVVLSRLLQRVQLTLESCDDRAVGVAALHPKKGVTVRVDAQTPASTR